MQKGIQQLDHITMLPLRTVFQYILILISPSVVLQTGSTPCTVSYVASHFQQNIDFIVSSFQIVLSRLLDFHGYVAVRGAVSAESDSGEVASSKLL